MKPFFLFIAVLTTSITTFAQIKTPSTSPAATVSQQIGLTNITVEYSRPSVKGRSIFGNLVPYGKVWRTGANKITTIKFDDDVQINGATLKAGTYGLYTIPGVDSWKIIINRDDKQWGAYAYDSNKDAISFQVQPYALDHMVEQMSIEFTEFTETTAFLQLSWETTAVRFEIKHDVHDKIMAEIKDKTSKSDPTTETLFEAADYYYQNNHELNQALNWATKIVEKEKEYWTYQLVARIAAKLNKCDIALPNAEKSMKLAKEAGDDAYIKLNENIFSHCKK